MVVAMSSIRLSFRRSLAPFSSIGLPSVVKPSIILLHWLIPYLFCPVMQFLWSAFPRESIVVMSASRRPFRTPFAHLQCIYAPSIANSSRERQHCSISLRFVPLSSVLMALLCEVSRARPRGTPPHSIESADLPFRLASFPTVFLSNVHQDAEPFFPLRNHLLALLCFVSGYMNHGGGVPASGSHLSPDFLTIWHRSSS